MIPTAQLVYRAERGCSQINRKAPRFIVVEDDGAAYAAHINELLRTLNVNGDAEETSQPEETEE